MSGWITAVIIAAVAVVGIWLGRRYGVARPRPSKGGDELIEALRKTGSNLGLEAYSCRRVFGAKVHTLHGTFNNLDIEVEVCTGVARPYARISIEFPKSISQDLRILSDRNPGLKNWFLRMREVEIGVEEFDDDFILLTRDRSHLQQILSPAVQYQLQRLVAEVDDLRIGDHSVFLYLDGVEGADVLKKLLKKSIEISERIFATAREIGPSRSKADATRYERGTASVYQRGGVEEGETEGEGTGTTAGG